MRIRSLAAAALTAVLAATAFTLATPTSASAATADRWGFAYVKDPTVPVWTTLDTSRQWGSWKTTLPVAWATGGKIAPGRFLVRFPGIGAGPVGVPHVTPVNRTGHYCEIVRWYQAGADQIVDVQCHRPGGAPDDSPFTVLWTTSSGVLPAGGAHAYVQHSAGAGLVQSYNSAGAPNSVSIIGPGQYLVRLLGVGVTTGLAGNVQATAVHPNAAPRRCKIYDFYAPGADVVASVFCHDNTGTPTPTDFTLSYHRQRSVIGSFAPPTYVGYLATAYGAGPTNDNSVLGVGTNTHVGIGAGHYRVTFKQLGVKETHAQVVAQGLGSIYCHFAQPWSYALDAEADVMCFDNAGAPAFQRFLTTFTSRL